MDNSLTEKEIKYLKRLIKYNEKLPMNYFIIGLLCCLMILGVIIGIKFNSKDGFLMAIYFGTISAILILKIITDKKILKIIKKIGVNFER
jgi:hypothetical protein